MSTNFEEPGDEVRFHAMLNLIDRLSGRPKSCPECRSAVLATLIPIDYPFTDEVRRAQDACRAAYASVEPGTKDAPVWRCLDCGAEIRSDSDR